MKLTIKNEFTGRSTLIDTDRPLDSRRVHEIRARLCLRSCTSGDIIGGRGPQDDPEAYEAFLARASRIVGTGLKEEVGRES